MAKKTMHNKEYCSIEEVVEQLLPKQYSQRADQLDFEQYGFITANQYLYDLKTFRRQTTKH